MSNTNIIKRKLIALIKSKGDCVNTGEENIGCVECPLSKLNRRLKNSRWDCKAKRHHRNNWVDVDDKIVYKEALKMFVNLYGKDELFGALL